jgi:hypothetical protein
MKSLSPPHGACGGAAVNADIHVLADERRPASTTRFIPPIRARQFLELANQAATRQVRARPVKKKIAQ